MPVEERTLDHQRNLPAIEQYIKSLDWDVFVIQADMGWWNDTVLKWAKEIQETHPEKDTIFYFPIDGDTSMPHAFIPLTWCSAPVVYTNHARSVIAKTAPEIAENVSVIWLGCEPDVFYPMPLEQRREMRVKFYGEDYLDRFIALNVNRNQQRKDLMRCMAVFHQFHQQHPDATLHLHSVPVDIGGSLPHQAAMVGCDVHKQPGELAFSNLNLAQPWSRETLNELYNAVAYRGCLVSTAYGEGWGLSTTEAMAAGLSVIVPANTANLDILGEINKTRAFSHSFDRERGWGVKTGGDIDHTVYIYANGNSMASTIHAQSFLDTLEYVYSHPEEAQAKAQVARDWTVDNSWERRQAEWQQLLSMIRERQNALSLQSTTIS